MKVGVPVANLDPGDRPRPQQREPRRQNLAQLRPPRWGWRDGGGDGGDHYRPLNLFGGRGGKRGRVVRGTRRELDLHRHPRPC